MPVTGTQITYMALPDGGGNQEAAMPKKVIVVDDDAGILPVITDMSAWCSGPSPAMRKKHVQIDFGGKPSGRPVRTYIVYA